jgi:hypothetical protein
MLFEHTIRILPGRTVPQRRLATEHGTCQRAASIESSSFRDAHRRTVHVVGAIRRAAAGAPRERAVAGT